MKNLTMDEDIRFGTRNSDIGHSTVKEYQLSDEELMKYRNGKPITPVEQAKRLLRDTFLYPHEIASMTGLTKEEVMKHYWSIRKKKRKGGWH